ncbi:MAG: serine/threonine protein kinase [Planctomycetes bacterium]|nr:serine/threonine protein kinase [Planctomycetota bacterium]
MHRTPDRHRQEAEVFLRASELQGEERKEFLAQACEGNPALLERIEALLAEDEEEDTSSGLKLGSRPSAFGLEPGTKVGSFEILRVLGEGGMGVVFEARQESPNRVAALKLMRRGLGGERERQRFEFEGEVLALLKHPGIAKIYQSGTAEIDGQHWPYFAMELIDGLELLEYARVHELDVGERLRLLEQVGEAVEHAHRNGVVHRDLKPSNILVDAEGRAHVLDFGIARLGESTESTRTRTGSLLGTVAYMSPEQAEGDPAQIGAASDVHALGVLGFELLTGSLPYPISGQPITKALVTLATEEPGRLSHHDRSLRGDLETLFAKALEKNPSDRYASAWEFCADLKRFRKHEPIQARPQKLSYRARKFLQRNLALSITSFVAVLAMIIGTFVSISWAVAADREAFRAGLAEGRAVEEAGLAESVTQFLFGLFESVAPEVARGQKVSALDVVDRGRLRLLSETDASPMMRARLMSVLGNVLTNMGEFDSARSMLDQAYVILCERTDVFDERREQCLYLLGRLDLNSNRFEDARTKFEQAFQLAEQRPEPRPLYLARVLEAISVLLTREQKYDEALAHLERARAIHEGLGDGVQLAETLELMATTHRDAGNVDTGIEIMHQAMDLLEQSGERKMRGSMATNLASLLLDKGNTEEAEALLREALRQGIKIYPPDHPLLIKRYNNLALLLARTGRVEEAAPLMKRAVEIGDLRKGAANPDHGRALLNMGNVHAMKRELPEAIEYWERATVVMEESLGPRHKEVAMALENIAEALEQLGKDEERAKLLRSRVREIRSR